MGFHLLAQWLQILHLRSRIAHDDIRDANLTGQLQIVVVEGGHDHGDAHAGSPSIGTRDEIAAERYICHAIMASGSSAG